MTFHIDMLINSHLFSSQWLLTQDMIRTGHRNYLVNYIGYVDGLILTLKIYKQLKNLLGLKSIPWLYKTVI